MPHLQRMIWRSGDIQHPQIQELLCEAFEPIRPHQPSQHYSWEDENLTRPTGRIEFHQPPPSLNVNEAIRYPESTMCFVGAAIQRSKEQLQTIPSNVGGLRWFLSRFMLPWLHAECTQMPMVWRGITVNAICGRDHLIFPSNKRSYWDGWVLSESSR